MDFTVPGSSGQYASEVYYLTRDGAQDTPGSLPLQPVAETQVDIQSLPASATLEMDLLKPGGDPDSEGDWSTARASWTDAGLQTPTALSRWPGVRYRMKSGGTGGAAVVEESHF